MIGLPSGTSEGGMRQHIRGSMAVDEPGLLSEASETRDRLHRILAELDEMVSASEQLGGQATAPRVRSILKARRMRAKFFEAELFSDPAWDMLLELYAAEIIGYRTQVSSLCIGSAVPMTTALRWIKSLERKGMFVRTRDPDDGRRVFVSLSEQALRQMNALLKAA